MSAFNYDTHHNACEWHRGEPYQCDCHVAEIAKLQERNAALNGVKQASADLERRLGVATQMLTRFNNYVANAKSIFKRADAKQAFDLVVNLACETPDEALKAIQSSPIQNMRSNIGGYCRCGDLIKQATFRSCSTDEIDTCLGERSQV